jgi:hypothetical protein
MSVTKLVLVHDDRQGRKGGVYRQTAKNININQILPEIEVHVWSVESLLLLTPHPMLIPIDAGINGRCYKPMAILESLKHLQYGDFLIYNDCSPEIWADELEGEFSLSVIHNLTTQNNDILTSFVKWDCQNIPQDGLGVHIHKYFTTNRCMDKMGLRQYENSYQHASGMMCIRKTPETVKFVEEWLHWNLDPECASLGVTGCEYWNAEQEFKVGHRHDQSISGLLLNQRNAKLVDILHNDMNPHNFLQFCRKDVGYKFIDSNSPVDRESLDMTKIFIRRGSKVYNEQGVELTVFRVDYVDGMERFIVGEFEESAWATTRDKLRLKK